jgi:putative solute:sodium symporter small subunit
LARRATPRGTQEQRAMPTPPDAPVHPPATPAPPSAEAYWRKTSVLMWTMLALWAIASFGIHAFASALNRYTFLGFPLGFYMAAQGSLIVFVVMLFWFAWRQNRIDEEFDVEEE